MAARKFLILGLLVFMTAMPVSFAEEQSLNVLEFTAKDTALGDLQAFGVLVNNAGNTHANATISVDILKNDTLVDSLAIVENIYSHKSRLIMLEYNTSSLKPGVYLAAARVNNKSVSASFEILEYREELTIKKLEAVPVKVGEPLIINLVLKNSGSVDLDYYLTFSIEDKFGNTINELPVKGEIDRFSTADVQTGWKTGKRQPNNYEVAAREYIVRASLNYGKKGSEVKDGFASKSTETILMKRSNMDHILLLLLLLLFFVLIAKKVYKKRL